MYNDSDDLSLNSSVSISSNLSDIKNNLKDNLNNLNELNEKSINNLELIIKNKLYQSQFSDVLHP